MKKIIAIAVALFATSAYANVLNSPHNLNPAGGPGVCRYCHTPHHANPAVTQAPIWARTLVSTYTPYQKYTANLATTNMSLLCMSCHDGVTNLGTVYVTGGSTTIAYNTSRVIDSVAATGSNLGTTLADDHPVGVLYDNAAPNLAGLVASTVATARGFVLFYANGQGGGTNMECGSCHDPHNYSSVTTDASYRFKRTVTGTVTDFCAACHELK